jgi:hypothetical protein
LAKNKLKFTLLCPKLQFTKGVLWRPADDNFTINKVMLGENNKAAQRYAHEVKEDGKRFEAPSMKKAYKTVKQDNRQLRVFAKIVENTMKAEGGGEPVHTRFLQAPLRKS